MQKPRISTNTMSVGPHRVVTKRVNIEGSPGHYADRVSIREQVCYSPSKFGARLKRLAVFDGVTPRDHTLMEKDMAVHGSTEGVSILGQTSQLPKGFIEINNALHNTDWGTLSPATTIAAVDTYLYTDPHSKATSLIGEFYATGDCEIYLHFEKGWKQINGGALLVESYRKKFEALLAEVKVLWDQADLDYQENQAVLYEVKRRITQESLIPREEALLKSIDAWRSVPLGRYSTQELQTRSFMPATVQETFDHLQTKFDGLVMNTDGAVMNVGILDRQTEINETNGTAPADMAPLIIEQTHPNADVALVTMHIGS